MLKSVWKMVKQIARNSTIKSAFSGIATVFAFRHMCKDIKTMLWERVTTPGSI